MGRSARPALLWPVSYAVDAALDWWKGDDRNPAGPRVFHKADGRYEDRYPEPRAPRGVRAGVRRTLRGTHRGGDRHTVCGRLASEGHRAHQAHAWSHVPEALQ